jgi:hypothetical protein
VTEALQGVVGGGGQALTRSECAQCCWRVFNSYVECVFDSGPVAKRVFKCAVLYAWAAKVRFNHPLSHPLTASASASASALLRVARAGPRRRLARLAVQRRRRSKPSAVKVAPEGNEASRCRVAAVRRLPRRPKLLANGARPRPDGLHQIGCIHSLTPCQTTHPRSIPSASGQSTQKALAYLDERQGSVVACMRFTSRCGALTHTRSASKYKRAAFVRDVTTRLKLVSCSPRLADGLVQIPVHILGAHDAVTVRGGRRHCDLIVGSTHTYIDICGDVRGVAWCGFAHRSCRPLLRIESRVNDGGRLVQLGPEMVPDLVPHQHLQSDTLSDNVPLY